MTLSELNRVELVALRDQLKHEHAENNRLLDVIFTIYQITGPIQGGSEIESAKRLRAEVERLTSEHARLRLEIVGSLTDAGAILPADNPCASGEIAAAVKRLKADADASVQAVIDAFVRWGKDGSPQEFDDIVARHSAADLLQQHLLKPPEPPKPRADAEGDARVQAVLDELEAHLISAHFMEGGEMRSRIIPALRAKHLPKPAEPEFVWQEGTDAFNNATHNVYDAAGRYRDKLYLSPQNNSIVWRLASTGDYWPDLGEAKRWVEKRLSNLRP